MARRAIAEGAVMLAGGAWAVVVAFVFAGTVVAATPTATALTGNPLTGNPLTGNPLNGERIYTRCAACHALDYDRTGPHHCGVLGRKAGSVAGFAYSAAMKRSGLVWNAATLDRFLADPLGTVPGTTMGYAGIADAHERADLIAFLARARCGAAPPR